MFFRITKKHQKLSSTVLLALFVFVVLAGSFAPAHQARSTHEEAEENTNGTPKKCGWTDIACGALAAVNWVIYGVFFFVGQIVSFELSILSWVMNALDWNNDIVELGWGITRDIANLFFIIVIMIIAFATVLQIESYGMKVLLPRFILIALLINFSLVICGFLINFSNALGDTFKKAGGEGSGFAMRLTEGLQMRAISVDDPDKSKKIIEEMSEEGAATGLKGFAVTLLSGGMAILSGLIMIFVVAALIFFMTVRQISLMMIVMLSPMAMIGLLLPDILGKAWSEWKEAFLKWVMFYPIFMFFFYVAIMILSAKSAMFSGQGLATESKGFTGITSIQAVWKLFFASMFLCGAIIAAQKMSITGAKAIGSFGTKQLKDLTGATRIGEAFKAAGKRREERREARRTLGLGAQLRERFGTREMRERALLERKEAEKKMQENQDKLHGVKRGRKGEVINVEDEAGLRKAANKRTIFGTVASARKNIAAKTLTKWEAKRMPLKQEKEEDLSSEAALALMGGGPKAK